MNPTPTKSPLSPFDISIIIVNWNTSDLLARALQSVQANGMETGSLRIETIVVDNASTDGSQDRVRKEFPWVQLIENRENEGFARANNRGIRASSGRYILLLNSDAFLQGSALHELVRTLDEQPMAGAVGAALFYPDGQPQACHGPLPTLRTEIASLLGLDKRGVEISPVTGRQGPVETGVVSGACLMARRVALESVGLLDEGFFMFSEETDLCYRFHAADWKVLHLPSARVTHVGGGSTGRTARRTRLLYQGKLLYMAKHHGIPAELGLLVAIWLTTLLKTQAYRLIHRQEKEGVRQADFWRAVAGELRGLRV